MYAQAFVDEVKKWIEQSSWQEKVQFVARMGTEAILYDGLFIGVGKICSSVIADAIELKAVEEIELLGQEVFQVIDKEKRVVTSIGSLDDLSSILLQHESEHVIQSAVGQGLKPARNLQDVLQELYKNGAKSRLFQKEVIVHFNEVFCKKELLDFFKPIQNLYSEIEIVDQGSKIILSCDLEHLMTYNLRFKLNPKTSLYKGFISGGHVGICTKNLEKAGEIIVLNEEWLSGGVRALEYEHRFGSFIAKKTEFPLHWSAQEIMESIKKSWHNQVYNKSEGSLLKIIGKGQNNVLIEMYMKKLPNGNLQLKTAYPYYERFSGTKL